jgi:hypothetical protein
MRGFFKRALKWCVTPPYPHLCGWDAVVHVHPHARVSARNARARTLARARAPPRGKLPQNRQAKRQLSGA